MYYPANKSWTNISSALSGSPPPRNGHRITSMGGKLFLHGGADLSGETALAIERLLSASESQERTTDSEHWHFEYVGGIC